jgi:hypothetical protein
MYREIMAVWCDLENAIHWLYEARNFYIKSGATYTNHKYVNG